MAVQSSGSSTSAFRAATSAKQVQAQVQAAAKSAANARKVTRSTADLTKTATLQANAFSQSAGIKFLQTGLQALPTASSNKAKAEDLFTSPAQSNVSIAADAFATAMNGQGDAQTRLILLQATNRIKAQAAAKQQQAAAKQSLAKSILA